MDSDVDDHSGSILEKTVPEKSKSGRRAYAKPVLLRLGTLQDITRTVGTRGARDGFQTTNVKRTAF
jgi:hypothetical protein